MLSICSHRLRLSGVVKNECHTLVGRTTGEIEDEEGESLRDDGLIRVKLGVTGH